MDHERGELRRSGIAASGGISIGRAYLVGRDTVKTPRHHVEVNEIDTEVTRLRSSIGASDAQLEAIKAKLARENESDYHIIAAHQLMLHDEHLVDAAIGYIREEAICAEWGLAKAVDDIRGVFDAIDDDYLRERKSDVEFVAERVLRNLLGREVGPLTPPPDAIVVAYDLSPADTAQLHKAAVAGLITDAGGRTSHTAIIARAHEIPAVVALEDITEVVESDDLLIVDGFTGTVIVNPSAATVATFREAQRRHVAKAAARMAHRDEPARTACGQAIGMYANIDATDEVAAAIEHGAIGIGLYRTEYLFMTSDEVPTEETHYQAIIATIRAMGGRPVTVRTFDLGADKLAKFLEDANLEEANPALGLRSIRLCMSDLGRPLFRAQLRAILRASTEGPLRIMFPMISGLGELREAKQVLAEVRAELAAEGIAMAPHVPVGIMVEMPAAAMMADLLAPECEFFSVGTNDLIQYTMAVDRVNEYVSYLYEPLHPGLLRILAHVAEAARQAGISCTVCGEMASDPTAVPVLLGLGIRDLSMSAVSIPEIKELLLNLRMPDLEAMCAATRSLRTADEIRDHVARTIAELATRKSLPA